MTTAYTSLLGLALPVTGELSGTWGDTVNNSITSLLDTSVAGTTNVSTDGDVTLTTTTGAANTARQAILLFSGARTALRTVTAPAQSKIYTVINATTGGFSVKLVGSGPTTGVTIVAGESAVCAWNGSDFIKISNTGGSASFVNLTASGTVTFTGLTASQAVFTNASDELVSNAITGTGNVVMSASPTLTGTIAAEALTASSTVTLSGGTANGVAYLNGSKVVTSGSALTFDGTTFVAPNSVITSSSSSNALRITQTGTGNALLVEDAANPDSTPFVIDATGIVIKGATTAVTSAFTIPVQVHASNSSAPAAGFGAWNWNDSGAGPCYTFNKARGGVIGTPTIVSSGDNLGRTAYYAYDGASWIEGARVQAEVDGTPGTNDMPGRLVFSTTADGASSPTERMRIDSSGNVGIGTSSPAYKLDVATGAIQVKTGASVSSAIYDWLIGYSGTEGYGVKISTIQGSTSTRHGMAFYTSAAALPAERMRIDENGNLGLGVTPSAWGAGYKAIQLLTSALYGTTSRDMNLGANVYVDGVGYKYIQTSFATNYTQYQGAHTWYTAPSGTAGTAITFTQAMTLDADGDLGIGTSSPENKLTIVKNTTAATENSYGIAIQSVSTNAYTELLLGASDAVDAGIIQTAAKNTNFTAKNLALQPQGGNVGIGTTSPTTKLDVVGSGDSEVRIRATSDASLIFSETTANKNWKLKPSAGDFFWQYSATAYNSGYSALMALTSTGNLGLGVTPSAWGNPLSKALEFNNGCYVTAYNTSGTDSIYVGANNYYNGTNYIYKNSRAATQYQQVSGTHLWFNAPSGTAGTAISFTQAMTLSASGGLSIGTTTDRGGLTVSSNSGTTIANTFTKSADGTSIGNGGTITISQFFGGGPVYSGTLYLTVIGGGGADTFNNITRQYAVRFYTNTGSNNQNTLTALTSASAASGGQGGNMTDIVASCTGTNSRDLTITVTTSTTENRRFHAVFMGSVV